MKACRVDPKFMAVIPKDVTDREYAEVVDYIITMLYLEFKAETIVSQGGYPYEFDDEEIS
jgi:hypothetical protein